MCRGSWVLRQVWTTVSVWTTACFPGETTYVLSFASMEIPSTQGLINIIGSSLSFQSQLAVITPHVDDSGNEILAAGKPRYGPQDRKHVLTRTTHSSSTREWTGTLGSVGMTKGRRGAAMQATCCCGCIHWDHDVLNNKSSAIDDGTACRASKQDIQDVSMVRA